MTHKVMRLALVAAATASMAACASKPKLSPTGPAQPTGPSSQGPEGPVIPGQPGGVGQAAIPGSEQDFVINVGDRVYFDFDSYDIRADAGPVLDAQAAWLNRYAGVRVRIEGNADERGTREYNLALGARRANSVRDYLVSRGISAGRIATISYGKEQPVDGGASEESYQRNRNARTAISGGAR
ncbi:MAG TPA: peptidoglycan-associated lipoprotein Pal [Phenylobacterium sp.]